MTISLIFEPTKKYKLTFDRQGHDLTYTATNIKVTEALISFSDKFNKQLIFPLDALRQAEEVKE